MQGARGVRRRAHRRGVRRLDVGPAPALDEHGYVNGSRAQPVNYDQAEPQFAEAKKLPLHGSANGVVSRTVTDTTNGFRYALGSRWCPRTSSMGAARQHASVLLGVPVRVPCARTRTTTSSVVPSERITPVRTIAAHRQYAGTRFYFLSSLARRATAWRRTAVVRPGRRRPPTMYPAWSYALTNAWTSRLGTSSLRPTTCCRQPTSALSSTRTPRSRASSAKYAPPRAQAILSAAVHVVRAHAEQEPPDGPGPRRG